jgi:hypothetical protein
MPPTLWRRVLVPWTPAVFSRLRAATTRILDFPGIVLETLPFWALRRVRRKAFAQFFPDELVELITAVLVWLQVQVERDDRKWTRLKRSELVVLS